jgi:hypothetical protein
LDQPGSATSCDVRRVKLIEGVTYYSNIIAYGFSGLHHTETSDGFKTDKSTPVTGFVFDGNGVTDVEYQSSYTEMAARWRGFSDVGSGIHQYYWCIGMTNSMAETPDMTECSARDWEAVGLHISVTRTLSQPLVHGKYIVALEIFCWIAGHVFFFKKTIIDFSTLL